MNSGVLQATRLRIWLLMIAATACAGAALALLPRAIEAQSLLVVQDDPAKLADRKLDRGFDSDVASREIESALAAGDADLASSFFALARDRDVIIAPALVEQVEAANAASASAASTARNFARGLITGEPDDFVSLAGTALGDLFVFGDIRDALREGSRWASGQKVDQLVLGLSCVGIAITAGTYATLGAGAPARIGLTIVKAARKTGRLGARMGEWITRALREIVDWPHLRQAVAGASLTEPALAVRAAREAVKMEKAEDLLRLTRDVGRVQASAGTQAALDALKLADGPRELARVARLAEAKGGKTRAILKFLGRGAIALTVAAFDLALWILAAILTLFGFISSTKGAVERATWRHLQRRKAKRLAERERRVAMVKREV